MNLPMSEDERMYTTGEYEVPKLALVSVTVDNCEMDQTDDTSLESSVKATFEMLANGTKTQLAQTIVDPNKKYSSALFRVEPDRVASFVDLVNALTTMEARPLYCSTP